MLKTFWILDFASLPAGRGLDLTFDIGVLDLK